MCRVMRYALPFVLFAATTLLLAGGPDCHKAEGAANVAHEKKCSMSAADCQKEMAEARSRGWLGLQLDQGEDGALTITKVYSGSPASKAGFREGDVLLALNGVTLGEENKEKLYALKKNLKPGDSVTYNVHRSDGDRSISAVLGRMPDDVYTAMVSEHMKEHADVASAK